MALIPDPPFPKTQGDNIRSKDWNDAVNEVVRLDNAKVDRAGDRITGQLTVDGTVGVRTTAGPASLTVTGTSWNQHLVLENTTDAGAGPGIFFNAAQRDWAILATQGGAGAGVQKLGFFDATAGAYRMVIDPAGNVGIGTVNPNARLEVAGGILSPMWRVTQVFNARQGALPLTSPVFQSGGGTLLIFASGSGFLQSGAGNIGMGIQIDGGTIGTVRSFTNESLSHKSFVANALVQRNVGAGNHTITLFALASTITDFNDWFYVTVLELPF